MNQRYLKKVKIANPLYNFRLYQEIEEYEAIKTDVQLVNFFHRMWTRFENRRVITDVVTMMMSFAVGTDIRSQVNKLID